MLILLSLAVEHRWTIRKMDVESACLQAKGFERDIYIGPPYEEKDRTQFWKLLVTGYGLVGSEHLWFLTFYHALTMALALHIRSTTHPFFQTRQRRNLNSCSTSGRLFVCRYDDPVQPIRIISWKWGLKRHCSFQAVWYHGCQSHSLWYRTNNHGCSNQAYEHRAYSKPSITTR